MTSIPTLPENLWTVDDVAEFLRASRSKVYKDAKARRIPSIRIGAMLRFDPNAVRRWVMQAGSDQLQSTSNVITMK